MTILDRFIYMLMIVLLCCSVYILGKSVERRLNVLETRCQCAAQAEE